MRCASLKLLHAALLCLALFGVANPSTVVVAAEARPWIEVDIGLIGPSSEDILASAMERATTSQAQGVGVRLHTPGGALDSTRRMVQTIMSAPFPVIIWVGPSGSRAGSAGAFITLAGHVAAMAPGTNIGAAHPIGANGDDMKGELDRKV